MAHCGRSSLHQYRRILHDEANRRNEKDMATVFNAKQFIFYWGLICLGCGGVLSGPQNTVAHQSPTVIRLVDAPEVAPPSAKARVRHLARGHNAYLGHLWIAPGAGVPLHRDPTEEYLFILEGGGLLIMDGKEHQLAAGHAVYMPANAQVQFKNGDVPTVLLQVFAGPQSADKYTRWQALLPSNSNPVLDSAHD